jgi:hypothetical protein
MALTNTLNLGFERAGFGLTRTDGRNLFGNAAGLGKSRAAGLRVLPEREKRDVDGDDNG